MQNWTNKGSENRKLKGNKGEKGEEQGIERERTLWSPPSIQCMTMTYAKFLPELGPTHLSGRRVEGHLDLFHVKF